MQLVLILLSMLRHAAVVCLIWSHQIYTMGLDLKHVNKVRKVLIGTTQSDSARLWLGNWWHIELLLPTSNFESQESECICWPFCAIHTQCQEIPRSSCTKHHKFDWGICHFNNQTQGWGTFDKYMICCFKSTAVMFFNQQNVFQIYGRPIGLCPRDTGEKALTGWFSKPMLVQCWTDTMLFGGA